MAADNGRKQNRRANAAAKKNPAPLTAPAVGEARATADSIIAGAERLAAVRVAEAAMEAEATVDEILDEAQRTAEALQSKAEESAQRVRDDAEETSRELLAQARTESEDLLRTARADVEKLRAEAVASAEEIRQQREAEAGLLVTRAAQEAEELLGAAARRVQDIQSAAQTAADALAEEADRQTVAVLAEARTAADQIRAEADGALTRGRAEAQQIRAQAQAEAEQLREHAEEAAERIRRAATDEVDLLRRDAVQVAERTRRTAEEEAGRQRAAARTAVTEAERLAENLAGQAHKEAAAVLSRAESRARELTTRADTALQEASAHRTLASTDAENLRKEAGQDRARAAEERDRALSPTLRKLEKRKLRDEDAERRRTTRRKEKEDLAEQRRTRRAERKAGRPTVLDRVRAFFRNNARRIMVIGPIGAPMAVAWSSQTSYAMDAFDWWLGAALGFAAAWELTTTFTAWMYHQARSQGDSGLIYRVMTWVFAAGAAAMNYAHHCGPDGRPTQAAVAFATMSIVGMILWELYASLLHRQHARAEGRVAKARPRIGLIRWTRYPRQSWTAWSLTINNESLDTLEKAWAAAGRHLAEHELVRRASGLGPLRRAIAKAIGVGQWVPVRSLPPVPHTWQILPLSGSTGPGAVPAYMVADQVPGGSPVSAGTIGTGTRATRRTGETAVSQRSHPDAETSETQSRETGSQSRGAGTETAETRSRETGSPAGSADGTKTAETTETWSRETGRDRSDPSRETTGARSRETGTAGSRPRQTQPAKVSPMPDKARETQRLLDVMWERGGPLTVQLGSKTQTGEAEAITGRPRSSAAKRLAEARTLYEAGHRTYRETETRATGTGR
ncbi:DUF2637 domain-containing protein [Streptomyces yaizuensis]|uniref:DUF2637 domain-containing protein n=1 Tax=Streptomyces yaizuensis TaxID=2989713 RepID=A0ABQ5P6I2_9ACTN|nr:DUF2637 domain-containing protein [Streptomyces sp. YSPA8]GLF98190.1 DUF2637 domain-containing protein [Streptomyces sp. YSPA8]